MQANNASADLFWNMQRMKSIEQVMSEMQNTMSPTPNDTETRVSEPSIMDALQWTGSDSAQTFGTVYTNRRKGVEAYKNSMQPIQTIIERNED